MPLGLKGLFLTENIQKKTEGPFGEMKNFRKVAKGQKMCSFVKCVFK